MDHEKILLSQIARGDEPAFRQLVELYANTLHTWLYKLTRNHQLAEELVQDTFIKIWISREALEGVRNFKYYLFTIGKNLSLNLLRKTIKEKAQQTEWANAQPGNPDDEQSAWQWNLIDEAVATLPPQQYKVWMMARGEGKKYEQVAQELNLSRETVKKYLQFATTTIIDYVERKAGLLLTTAFFSAIP